MNNLLIIFVAAFTISSCSKSTENLAIAKLSDYAPAVAGKYITYSLDSSVSVVFGSAFVHHFYEAKYTVGDSTTDLLDRKSVV